VQQVEAIHLQLSMIKRAAVSHRVTEAVGTIQPGNLPVSRREGEDERRAKCPYHVHRRVVLMCVCVCVSIMSFHASLGTSG